MISVPGYKQLQPVHQGLHNLVYSGTRTKDGKKVILRQLRPEISTPELISRHLREFELLAQIQSDHVIKPIELIDRDDSPILVTEEAPGKPLISFIQHDELNIVESARIACLMAMAVDDIHRANIVHRDINPANIIYDAEKSEIKFFDFSISTPSPPSQLKPEVNRTLEGTLSYLSPEQTGRMNRSVDFRSDFYSLGITLYQLLTGRLPFNSEDNVDLICQHLTHAASPPENINPAVPKALSKITLKLRIWRSRRSLRKWAHHSPENILHRLHLVEAELAAHYGNQLQATEHFELAIRFAQENGYLNDLALASSTDRQGNLASQITTSETPSKATSDGEQTTKSGTYRTSIPNCPRPSSARRPKGKPFSTATTACLISNQS
jgi:serine/threonine protein kinase